MVPGTLTVDTQTQRLVCLNYQDNKDEREQGTDVSCMLTRDMNFGEFRLFFFSLSVLDEIGIRSEQLYISVPNSKNTKVKL